MLVADKPELELRNTAAASYVRRRDAGSLLDAPQRQGPRARIRRLAPLRGSRRSGPAPSALWCVATLLLMCAAAVGSWMLADGLRQAAPEEELVRQQLADLMARMTPDWLQPPPLPPLEPPSAAVLPLSPPSLLAHQTPLAPLPPLPPQPPLPPRPPLLPLPHQPPPPPLPHPPPPPPHPPPPPPHPHPHPPPHPPPPLQRSLSPPSRRAVEIVATINRRFNNGRPSNDLSEAGVLLQAFPDFKRSTLTWLCLQDQRARQPKNGGWARLDQERLFFSASLLAKGINEGFARFIGTGGPIFNPAYLKVNCAYPKDGATSAKRKATPPGCSCTELGGAKRYTARDRLDRCPTSLKEALERDAEFPRAYYNEVVVDALSITSNLPQSILAFWFDSRPVPGKSDLICPSGGHKEWSSEDLVRNEIIVTGRRLRRIPMTSRTWSPIGTQRARRVPAQIRGARERGAARLTRRHYGAARLCRAGGGPATGSPA